ARADELAMSSTEALLSLPSDVTDRSGQMRLLQELLLADAGGEAIAPGRLDQHAPGRRVARLGDLALTARASARVLRWHQADIGHQLPGIVETSDVSQLGYQSGRSYQSYSAQGLQRFNQWRQRPLRQSCDDLGFQTVAPFLGRLDGCNVVF